MEAGDRGERNRKKTDRIHKMGRIIHRNKLIRTYAVEPRVIVG